MTLHEDSVFWRAILSWAVVHISVRGKKCSGVVAGDVAREEPMPLVHSEHSELREVRAGVPSSKSSTDVSEGTGEP